MALFPIITLFFLLLSCENQSHHVETAPTAALVTTTFGVGGALLMQGEWRELKVKGMRKVNEEMEIKVSDRFHLGSCTKAMNATLAALLVEQNYLRWDSPLKDLLPEVPLHP